MDYFNKIEDYLLNELSAEERSRFEKEAKQNKDLAKEIELQRFEYETIIQLEEDDLRQKLKSIKRMDAPDEATIVQEEKKPAIRRSLIYRGLALAASILILIGFFFLPQYFSTESNIMADIYNSAGLSFGTTNVRSGNNGEPVFNPEFVTILKQRNTEKSKEVIKYFRNFNSDSAYKNSQARLNLGHAYLLANEDQSAVSIFSKLLEDGQLPTRSKEEARFFKAIALLQSNQEVEGKILLNEIVNENGRYSKLAEKVLSRY